MKTVYIVSSIKSLNHDYEHLQWLRLFFLSYGYHISEDWISHSLNVRNNRPYFKAAPDFDYMKVATETIRSADKLVFLMSESSAFTLTLLRYALHLKRHIIVVCQSSTVLQNLEKKEEELVTVLHFGDYQKQMSEVV
jgi:hypothetical protein